MRAAPLLHSHLPRTAREAQMFNKHLLNARMDEKEKCHLQSTEDLSEYLPKV